ncbi:MAG: phosphotransferase [bacterium]|nr:phosphotransferase [bacterium]
MVYKQVPAKDLEQIIRVLKCYDFKTKEYSITQNTLANVNKIFLVKTHSNKYILRESNPTTTTSHLYFEADILDYLTKNKFNLTPHLFENTDGDLITTFENKYYSLQEFLPGEVKESVSNLIRFNDAKLVSFFQTSANFTKTVQDFKGEIPHNNKTLYFYVTNGITILHSLTNKVRTGPVKELLEENQTFLEELINNLFAEMKMSKYDEQPKQVVHFDIHPGNMNYIGDRVSGLFDFDWARWDCRLTDLACTIGQSCYSYRGKNRALYNAQKIKLALETYRKTYGKSEYDLSAENQLLRVAFKGYMLYQLFWIIEWFLANTNKPEDGLKFISFSINVLKLNDFDNLIGN